MSQFFRCACPAIPFLRSRYSSGQSQAVVNVLQALMQEHGNVVFGGDGYSSEWHRMAVEERGLKNIPTTADALPALLDPAVEALFSSTGVLTPKELKSRYEVYSEQYILSIEVEAKLVIEMATTGIYPAALSYLIENTDAMAAAATMNITFENTVAEKIADATNKMMATVEKLRGAIEKHDFSSTEEHMKYCAGEIRSLMDETRIYADTLEGYISNKLWPYPKYSEMLFIK